MGEVQTSLFDTAQTVWSRKRRIRKLPGSRLQPVPRRVLRRKDEAGPRRRMGCVGFEPTTDRLRADCSTAELATQT
jgi:hypothetical protein